MNIKKNVGLNTQEVLESRETHGSNEISKLKRNTFLSLLLQSLGDPIIKILLIALSIKIVFLFQDFDWFETIGIVIAIFLSSFISSISEYGSEEAFSKLQEESSKLKCRVRRNGKLEEILVDEVVVGDYVLLASGEKIPADGYLVEGEITVDESSLNGEAREVLKKSVFSASIAPKKENEVMRGSVVFSKEAVMLVTSVGDNTIYGKLAKEIQEASGESPLKIRLRGLANVISRIGYIAAGLVTLSYLINVLFVQNNFEMDLVLKTATDFPLMFSHLLYAATLSVTIIVVAVPEGLPMMITLVLSSNMKRMLKDNVLVRKLVGIETAGSLNILFTDKTGTLTKGKLEVIEFIDGDYTHYKKEEDIKSEELNNLFYKSVVVNNASNYGIDKQIIGGNITDRALLSFVQFRDNYKYKIIEKTSFDSKEKYASIKIDDGKVLTFIKGASEKLLPICTKYYKKDGTVNALVDKSRIHYEIERATNKGMRVLLLATSESGLKELTYLGIVLIKDDVRPEALEGIKLVSKAGIKTVMITGDAKKTAVAIGRDLGLIKNDRDLVLTSEELNALDDEELKKIIPNLSIVARALPNDKSRLVTLSQELNLVVGMTGDGVNDAPALKKADVGFAMGSGTEVSKEASDIVILDDNFLSISKAILYGRTIFKSIRKFIVYQLTCNMCALVMSIIGPFIGVATPITIVQMLWINMIMDTFAGLAFSFEPPLLEYMDEVPKKKSEPIINKYMYSQVAITGLYSAGLCLLFLKLPIFKELIRNGENYKYLMTAYFALFIFIDVFNSFNARTQRLNLLSYIRKNKVFLTIFIFIAIVQVYIIYFGGDIFRTYGLTSKELILVVILAFTVIPVDLCRKFIVRKKGWQKGF